MTTRISKSASAEIAHFLPHHPKPENQRIHGHSIIVTVTAEGECQGGMVQEFGVFGSQVEQIVGLLDHCLLNEAHPEINPPTLENIAEWLGRVMVMTSGDRKIVSVRVERPTCREAAEWLP